MSDWSRGRDIILGQPVQLRTGPAEKLGYIVAVMLTEPYDALVRWRNAEPTFEPLDNLIEAPFSPV
jgi:hypothetical protein